MNFYEKEIANLLNKEIKEGNIRIHEVANEASEVIESFFPIVGSKINWERIDSDDKFHAKNDDDGLGGYLEFYRSCSNYLFIKDDINETYFGDGVTDFVLNFNAFHIEKVIEAVFDTPQTHYFYSNSWVMCFSFEGDMDFSFSEEFFKKAAL